jgi:glycosyltransferase involved in cell wall biosynthesis
MLDVTGLIITFNECENIGRCLDRLQWLTQIIVLDSFSTDGTCDIARSFPNVRVEQHEFDSFAHQCNYGLSLVSSAWVLSFDADYLLATELATEIRDLKEDADIAGYSAGFRYCVYGKALRATIYPHRTVLYRRKSAVYYDEGHGHRVQIDGIVRSLSGRIDHDDRKPLSRWVVSQDAYACLEARYLLTADPQALSPQDRLRLRVFYAPPVMFCYLLLGRGLIFDGWRGWFYVAQRVVAELLLSLRLLTEKHGLEESGK